jgi:DNA-binding response OmpR family regulator
MQTADRRADTIRVALVFDVPFGIADLPARTAQLADEFGALIARSVPGVRARHAVIVPAGSPVASHDSPRPRRGLVIDRSNRQVWLDGDLLHLTYREFELLCYLAARPRSPVTRGELVGEVWNDRAPGQLDESSRTVDTHVRRLRAKLGRYAHVVTTIRGLGYRFDPGRDVSCVAVRIA